MSGVAWTTEEDDEARRLKAERFSIPQIAAALNRTPNAVENRLRRLPVPEASHPEPLRLPAPSADAGGPSLPSPVECSYVPYVIDSGPIGVISDAHIPYHSLDALNDWVGDCKKHGVTVILCNGDMLDMYQVSRHWRDPSKPRMQEEISKARQFFEYLRATFPKAHIVFKFGNHDERLERYLAERAPDVFDLEDIQLRNLLRLKDLGIEPVQDKVIVQLGKLPVIHGHEYRGGGGVMPARWLFLRTGESALMGHFHQASYYTFRTITGKEVGMWSTGCACYLSPLYAPLNQWGHGWAIVEIGPGGTYHVHNRRRLTNGQVV